PSLAPAAGDGPGTAPNLSHRRRRSHGPLPLVYRPFFPAPGPTSFPICVRTARAPVQVSPEGLGNTIKPPGTGRGCGGEGTLCTINRTIGRCAPWTGA